MLEASNSHRHSHLPNFLILFIIFFLMMSVPCSSAKNLTFNYPTLNPNIRAINYSGNASTSDQGIQLTTNQKDKTMDASSGRATYNKQMQLWDRASGKLADFTTNFSFTINSQNENFSNYADGMAFFLAAENVTLPREQGGGLGLVNASYLPNSTAYPFVAVEFDTFPNEIWEDPHVEHVGININSMRSVTNVTWFSRIPSGQRNEAWISYNSSTKNLSVVFTGFSDNGTTIQQHLYYVADLREYLPEWVTFGFSAATGSRFEIHTLHSWGFSSSLQIEENNTPIGLAPVAAPTNPDKPNKGKDWKVVLGLVLSTCILVTGLGLLWFSSRKKRNRVERKDDILSNNEFENETGPKKYSYKELSIATKNFAEEEKLGEGGFGGVYKGFLRELNSYVAVKRVSRESKQGTKEYASEVRIISQLRHRNLVQLIGWCHEERELLLVYDFMPNGSLDSHLFKENSLLTWVMRYNIARGLASALFYLHEEWEQCVLHRDIKSSNVMLDSNFNAKLGDFGLARLVDHGKGSQTTVLAGTMGYMSNECFMTGKATKESDVYSYGVVALEIACGRKPIDPLAEEGHIRLVDWVWELYGTGKLLQAADAKLCGDFDEEQMECLMMVGLWCVHPDYNLRPSIKQAIQVLNFEAPLPNIPLKMPMYLTVPLNMSAFSLSSSRGTVTSSQSLSSSCNPNSSTASSSSSSAAAMLLHSQ